MACPPFETFKNVTHIGNDQFTNMLESNLQFWYSWALLKVGAWVEVAVADENVWGADKSQLRLVTDEADYTDGQVWEGARKDWVWETGVDYVDVDSQTQNPLAVGTPQVNGSPTAVGYHVNYPLGRIVFDTAIATTSTVKVAHSYRSVQVYKADDVPWFRELQLRSIRSDSSQFLSQTKGDWRIGGQHRIQLPTIVLEATPSGRAEPYEIGSGSIEALQDVLFHILAESRVERNNLIDIIRSQVDKSIWLFDTNSVNAASAWPLDYRGMTTGSNTYSDLVDADTGYRWRQCRMENTTISEVQAIHPNLYEAMVRTTMRVILGGT